MSRSKLERQRRGPSGRRRRRYASEWRELVEAHHRSGQTVQAFCAEWDVSEASFYAWRRHLERQAAAPVESSGQHKTHEGDRTADSAAFVQLHPQAEASSDLVEVQFACGATLRCASSHLPALVRLLKAEANEAGRC